MNPNVARKLAGIWNPHSETTTGPDGSYTLTVFRGAGAVGVAGPQREAYMPACVTLQERKTFFKVPLFPNLAEDHLPAAAGENIANIGITPSSYHALVLLEPDEKDEALVRDVALELPQERKGRVVGPDGQPLTGVTVSGLGPNGVVNGAEFFVRGINPKAKRQLVFHHKEKNLGFFLKELPGDPPEPLTIKLQACGSASGRLVDSDGLPVAGERIALWGGGRELKTDKEGRFRAEGLVPGLGYGVMTFRVGIELAHWVVEPGQHKDLGDIKVRDN
jgi:hypothetical protein